MERARPQFLAAQRDSDANQDVQASRMGSMGEFSTLSIRTDSDLIGQFKTDYSSRVFNATLPWCVGGPILKGSRASDGQQILRQR